MKTWLLVLFLAGGSVLAQVAATDSQTQALQRYPSLGQDGSAFNRRFVARLNSLRVGNDPMLQRADWPVLIADQVGTELGIEPALPPLPSIAAAAAPEAKKEPWKPSSTMLDKAGSTDVSRPATGHEKDNPLAVVAGRKTLSGTVYQRTSAGLIVSIRGGLIWLEGFDAREGQKITVPAVPIEPKSYTAVNGAERMIDAYRSLK